jgi:hypothetical protein
MAAQCRFDKMIEPFALHHVPIQITGSRSAPRQTEC